ncbi:DUF488 domain-containing protein [Phaeodactylibacter luteus]|uniref:DUF488 family protein n=1 Tax=Phaeodactylibacter luteus TaxID=1564516 RepID=A0A5C6S549_9BACT|nr:DUF488 family protein [Phaeodactylibacter luteus]TXB69543.1 DUF488 family protein [Phaeodactylibacter luteus]
MDPALPRINPIYAKRIYEAPASGDGRRILVDRLWPRGMSKGQAPWHIWLKEASPSAELRKWFAHQPERWEGFVARYEEELKHRPEVLSCFRGWLKEGPVTLLYSARDEQYNQAVALKHILPRLL